LWWAKALVVVQSLADSEQRSITDMTKKRRRHKPEQIIGKLDKSHRQLAAGKDLDEVSASRIAESIWHRWLA
jgi:hypothetical protein